MRLILILLLSVSAFCGDAATPAQIEAADKQAKAEKNVSWREKYGVPYFQDLIEMEAALREVNEIPTAFRGSYYAVLGVDPDGGQYFTTASYVVKVAGISVARTEHGGDLPVPKLWAGTLGGLPSMLAVQNLTDGRTHRLAITILKSGRAQVWEHSWVDKRGQLIEPAYFCQISR